MNPILLSALLLAAPAGPASAATPEAPSTPAPSPEYFRCLDTVSAQARSAGVSPAVFDRHARTVTPDPALLGLLDAQPEFSTPIWDYLAGLVDEQRVAEGKAMLQQHAATLAEVSERFGVDPETVVAVWGVESDYGKTFGKRPLLTSLTTLSCMGRRQAFFRGELVSTLQIIESGDVKADDLVGSWAGAFGHTQFMPSTFQRIAVDFDGDGRRDLVGSVPDALASTANYLKRSGWRTGEPWGYEIALPAGFDVAASGRTSRRPLTEWLSQGIKRVDGGAIAPTSRPSAVLLPAGKAGPAFLVFKNFDAIYSYNAAESYALAIAHLSDRLRGKGPIQRAWPTTDPGLSRIERRELQTLLLARGHAIGEVDGMIGSASRAAIAIEQERLGLSPADGRASQRVLRALRSVAGRDGDDAGR